MKKMNKKAFTLIELLVVISVIGILVLLGIPRFIGHTQKAELTRIQHDIKVMEQEVGTVLSTDYDDFNEWENNSKDLNQLIQEGKLFEKEGVVKKGEPIDGSYKVIPEKYKDKINTKLKGTFYANSGGKVYYEHLKPLSGLPTEPEKEQGYSDEEIQDLIDIDFIPVATADELNSIRYNDNKKRTYGKGTIWEDEYLGGLDKHYVQVLDINLSDYSKDEEGWNPIGTLDENATLDESATSESELFAPMFAPSFKGTYDGGNYVIRGLEVKGEGKEFQGLFGVTQGATIRNVGLIDNKVTGIIHNVGGLVGMAMESTIENSYATGSVEGAWGVGGLVGMAVNSTIDNSYATGSVTGAGNFVGRTQFVGGLVGNAQNSTIENSYATGSVTGTRYVGGLVGWTENSTKISDSYATGEVSGRDYVGGLVGEADDSTEISNSYATGKVTGSGYELGSLVGGLVGVAGGSIIENSYATGSVTGTSVVGGLVGEAGDSTNISNSYATGEVTGSAGLGGLVGVAWDSTISNSYWDKETTGQESSPGGGTGKSTNEMKNQATYPDGDLGWDFTNIWEITPGNYPTLR